MSEARRVFRLGDACLKIGSGATPRGGASVYTDSGTAFIRSQNIYNDHFEYDGLAFISEAAAQQLSAVTVDAEDVLLNITGNSVARVNRIPCGVLPARVSQHVMIIRPRPGHLDSRYLHYYLASPNVQSYLLGVASAGGTRAALTKGFVESVEVEAPTFAEQARIGRTLAALDDKIALNSRLNHTLEATAAAIFQKWCDDNDVSTEAVQTETLIANGVLLINDGYRAKNAELAEAGLPFARAGNLQSHFDFSGADLLGDAGVRAAREKVSQPFDCVFTSKGTVGRIAQVLPSTPRFVYSPQLCFWRSLRPGELNPFVLNQWMNGDEFREQIDAVKGQTDMADYVSLRDQRRMTITLPLSVDQARIGARLESLARMQDANFAESRTLAALRDALLPQLLSGRIRMRDAERLVGATV